MARHEDDRDVNAGVREPLLAVEAPEARHADVEDQTRGRVGLRTLQKVQRRGEELRTEADRADQIAEGLANPRIVAVISWLDSRS